MKMGREKTREIFDLDNAFFTLFYKYSVFLDQPRNAYEFFKFSDIIIFKHTTICFQYYDLITIQEEPAGIHDSKNHEQPFSSVP